MLEKGKILIDRKITSWRWYKDEKTFKLFFHLILTANYKDVPFEDIIVERGQRVASISSLSRETGLTERQIRTAIKHLKTTNEVTSLSTPKYTVFTIKNYDLYQKATSKLPNDRQTDAKRPPNDRRQCNKDKSRTNKEEKNRTVSAAFASGEPAEGESAIDRVMREHIGATDF